MGLRPRFLNIMPDGRGPEAPPTLPKSLVLAAHGSRCGGAASALRKIAARLEKRDLSQQVLTSFHQGQPAFGQVPGLVSGDGVVVVPVFLAEGYYSRKVLPRELLRAPRFRPIDIWLTPVVGCDSRLPSGIVEESQEADPTARVESPADGRSGAGAWDAALQHEFQDNPPGDRVPA